MPNTLDSISLLLRLEALGVPSSILDKVNLIIESDYFPFLDQYAFSALCEMIIFATENGWSENEILNILFNPVKPSRSDIETFRSRHRDIYREKGKEIATRMHEGAERLFTISSSMYAGKSTLAVEVTSELGRRGYKVITMVPDFMGDFVTIRGHQNGAVVGADGFVRIPAIQYSHDRFTEIIQSFGIAKDEKAVIHFDEFSFLPYVCIKEFIEYILEYYPNVKILFVGLNKNALGLDLAGYNAAVEEGSIGFKCFSFVPNEIDIVDDSIEPTGTFTHRYLVFPDGLTMLDCGFLPVVVPKELGVVYYTPSTEAKHFSTILTRRSRLDLLQRITHPNNGDVTLRDGLLSQLKERIVLAEQ